MENGMTLTHAEWEVAQECAKGLQDKEVADRDMREICAGYEVQDAWRRFASKED